MMCCLGLIYGLKIKPSGGDSDCLDPTEEGPNQIKPQCGNDRHDTGALKSPKTHSVLHFQYEKCLTMRCQFFWSARQQTLIRAYVA